VQSIEFRFLPKARKKPLTKYLLVIYCQITLRALFYYGKKELKIDIHYTVDVNPFTFPCEEKFSQKLQKTLFPSK
jgi:hypothetical protein